MNRTITMNLSGIIFHIEEDAYEKLNKYLSTIRGYFNTTEGRDEIMGDIESRIAEMLQEKVSQAKQAVLLADVESVIAVMGKPEDFAADNEQKETQPKQETVYEPRYRRLFRDPDDKLVGGVCSGISNYFDIDPIWIRLAFAIALFVFGSGFLLYLILWMIIPVARTTAEKLQMRGEKVDINNIGKAVHEEFNDVKKRVNRWGEEINSPEGKERIKSSARSLGDTLAAGLRSIFTVAGKIFSIIFLIISIMLLTGLLAGIFGKGNFMIFDADTPLQFSLYEVANSVLPNSISPEVVVITLVLFCGIPLLFIIYSCVKFLFNIRQTNKIVNYVASVLWLIGIAMVVYIGVSIGNDFSTEAYTKKKVELVQPGNKKLYLDINPAEDEDSNHYVHYTRLMNGRRIRLDNWTILSKEDNHYRLGYPIVDIVPSETDSFQLIVIKSANGPDKREASLLARNIGYETLQKDSLLLFNSYFDIAENDKFRAQEVKIILKVPVNSTIYLGKRMERLIFDIDNITNTLDRDMVNRNWKMTPQGLECVDCTGLEATINDPVHVTFDDGDVEIEENSGEHKHIVIQKGKHDEDYDTEDIKNESGKKVIIRKKVKDGDKDGDGKKIIIEKEIRNEQADEKKN